MRNIFAPPPGRAEAKAKGKRKKQAGGNASSYPAVPAGLMSHAEAKALCPPKGHIWRGFSQGAWSCHYP
eukprot:8824194-Lingulodinium_polyedra.AAC.1